MIFDFLKRLFGLVDDGTRKRRADDIDNDCAISAVSPKKHCCEREGIRAGKVIYANENDEEEIEYLGDSHYSPVRSKERSNGGSCAKRQFTEFYSQPLRTFHKNSIYEMNGGARRSDGLGTKSPSGIADLRYSTLTKTNQLREKQEYGQLIQRFLPQKCCAIGAKISSDEATKRRQITEVIDLERDETPTRSGATVCSASRKKQTREIFTTPATSTPLRWYTPMDTRNHSTPRPKSKENEISAVSARKASSATRARNDEHSILKIGGKIDDKKLSSVSIERIIPIIRIDHAKDRPRSPSACKNLSDNGEASTSRIKSKNYIEIISTNTLRDNLAARAVMKQDFVPRVSGHYNERFEQQLKEAEELRRRTCLLSKHNRLAREAALEEQLTRSMRLCEAVLDEREEIEDAALPELTPIMLQEIKRALVPHPPNEILVENFGLRIARKDINTLSGLNWLNDEVVNFYMNLLIVRGTKNEKYPKVHAMNTFFYPKLLSGGHSSLKRWTRKIDIFAQDILVVPIHLGIHWCMSIVDFRDKTIRYFDSMGGSNPKCLATLRRYLEDESMDKRKKPFDANDWKLESMRDIPQQMNGSDCGVFSCMFAEFITANRKIIFTQQDMPYFRNKMVYEILKSKLL